MWTFTNAHYLHVVLSCLHVKSSQLNLFCVLMICLLNAGSRSCVRFPSASKIRFLGLFLHLRQIDGWCSSEVACCLTSRTTSRFVVNMALVG